MQKFALAVCTKHAWDTSYSDLRVKSHHAPSIMHCKSGNSKLKYM